MAGTEFKTIRVGRGATGSDGTKNNIRVDHPSVSRAHLDVFIDPEGNVFITDLQSRNGTYVNGNRITGNYLLMPGDILKLGSSKPVQWRLWLTEDLANHNDPGQEKSTGSGPVEDRSATTFYGVNKGRWKNKMLLLLLIPFLLLLLGVGAYFMYYRNNKDVGLPDSGSSRKYSIADIKKLNHAQLPGTSVESSLQDGVEVECADGMVKLEIKEGKIVGYSADITPPPPLNPPVSSNPDRDGDGIPDDRDKCPDEKGEKKYGGCAKKNDPVQAPTRDRDGDGIPDDKDNCPDEKGSLNNNGCPVTSPTPQPPAGKILRETIYKGESGLTFYKRVVNDYPGCNNWTLAYILKQCNLQGENEQSSSDRTVFLSCP